MSRLHALLHLDSEIDGPQCRFFDRNGCVHENHQAVSRETDECCCKLRNDSTKSLIVLRQHAHDFLWRNCCGKCGKASQVAEYDDDFCAAPVQHAVIARSIDKVGHLRCEESLELRYAFLVLLRERQFGSHLVKAVCKTLKFVPGLDRNAVVEGPGADPLGAFLKQPYRFGHPVRQCIGKQRLRIWY